MQPSVNYDIQFVGGVKTALFGGEGLFFATLHRARPRLAAVAAVQPPRRSHRQGHARRRRGGAKKDPCSAASATCWTETRMQPVAVLGAPTPSVNDAAQRLFATDESMPCLNIIYVMKGLGKVHPARPRRPQGHLALVPARRQDRRARPERRRQEHAAADHGGAGHRVPRRGLPRPGQHRRLPAAGAAARSDEDGPRDRRRGRRRDARAARPLRRDQRASSARTCRPRRWTRSSRSRARSRIASTR